MQIKKIKSLYELYQLTQLIQEATRIIMTTSTLIDHIITNTPENVCDSGVIHTGISDHSLVFAIRKISVARKVEHTVEIKNMKKFDTKKLLTGLSSNKATGVDKISCKIIKIASPAISDSLTHIFNQAITLSLFPDEWKTARVIPLYKNGQRNVAGNYRPISVLPAISKIMEKILYD